MTDNKTAPKPSAPTRKLAVQPSKAPKQDTWHAGLRVSSRISDEAVVKLAALSRTR